MILSRRHLAAWVVVVAAATSCASGSDDSSERANESPTVVATTSIWADITSNVLCGETVAALVPPGVDPHTFEPSLRDRELIEGADLIVTNGSDLEGGLLELIDTASADDAIVVEITPHVDVITSSDGHHDDHHDDHGGDHDDDAHGGDQDDEDGAATADESDGGSDDGSAADPHVWQDPSRVAGALGVIGSAGAETGRPDCSDDVAAELMELDTEIADRLAVVPPAQRVIVTSHDSLAYFADRYDLEVVGTVIPSTNTLAATNAADLATLADLIDARGVHVIFTEELESTTDADALAERLGVEVVSLVTDALTNDPPTDTYVGMMRSNARSIAEALES